MPNTSRTTSKSTSRSTTKNTTRSTTTYFNTSFNTTTSYTTTYGTSRGTSRTTTYNTYYNTSHSTTYNTEWSVSTTRQTTAQTTSAFNTTYYTTLSQNTTIFTNTNTTVNTPTTTFSVSTTGPVYRATNFFRPKEVSQTNLMLNLDARVSAGNTIWRDQSGNSRNATVSGTMGVSDRCVALYNFHSDATDLTGNYTGTETDITYASGNYGQSAVFNGTNSYIYASNSVQQPTTNFSASVWVLFHQIKTSSVGVIGNFKTGVTPQVGWAIAHQNGTPLQFWADGTANSNGGMVQSTSSIPTNEWIHVVGTYDGSNVKIYINGSLENTKSYTQTPATTDQPLVIGRWYGNFNGSYTDGQIDQVRIYSKSLSSTEVTQLYNEDSSTLKKVDIFNDTTDGHYNLDGTDSFYMNQFITDQNFTIGGWFYRNSAGGSSGYESLWTQGFAPAVRCQIYGADGTATGNRLYIYLHNGSTGVSYDTGIDLPTGSWFHLMKTYDLSAGTVKVYLNSALKKTQSTLTGNIYSSGNSDTYFRVAKNSNNNSGYINGKISQVRVYDSVLTDTQIVDDYSTHDYLYI